MVEQAAREAHIKSGGTGEAFDVMKPQLKAALITRFWRNACWPYALLNYTIEVEREMDLLDMLTYAASPRNSDTREGILLPRIDSVVTCFKKLSNVLQGCEDDDDAVRNIRNLQNACPSLPESAVISIELLTHLDEVLSMLGAALTSVCAQPKVERIIAIVGMLSPSTNSIGGAYTNSTSFSSDQTEGGKKINKQHLQEWHLIINAVLLKKKAKDCNNGETQPHMYTPY